MTMGPLGGGGERRGHRLLPSLWVGFCVLAGVAGSWQRVPTPVRGAPLPHCLTAAASWKRRRAGQEPSVLGCSLANAVNSQKRRKNQKQNPPL